MHRTIALTGATGFIGSTVARTLLAEGWRVQALIRPSSRPPAREGSAIRWIEGSLEHADSLRRLLHSADAVVHCAGAVRGTTAADFRPVNVEGVARLAGLAAASALAPRFLLISSLAARQPSLSPYAASKHEGERALSRAAERMTWAALRPPAVYGPGDRALLPLLLLMSHGVAPVLGRAEARFSMLYVDDLAKAITAWLASDRPATGAFELHDGNPSGYSWQDLIETMERVCKKRLLRLYVPGPVLGFAAAMNHVAGSLIGYRPIFTPGKVRELRHVDWVCDNTAFTGATRWTPQVSLNEGLRRTLLAGRPRAAACHG